MYGGKFAFQNRLGLYLEGNFRLKIDWASCWKEMLSIICRKFTETHLEDVDLSKTQPRKCFVMHGPRKSSYKQTLSDCNHLAQETIIWQVQKFICYCTVTALFFFVSEGSF